MKLLVHHWDTSEIMSHRKIQREKHIHNYNKYSEPMKTEMREKIEFLNSDS